MKIVVAMDSLKGSLRAERACRIVADAIAAAVPAVEVVSKPMADGGEGTASAMITAANGSWIPKTVTGPLPGMKVNAGFAWFDNDKSALVEMACASGLELLKANQQNPLKTTTYGTGELIEAALNKGAKKILLAVGGSATVDGGVGAATALGWQFLDTDNRQIAAGGAELLRINSIIPPPKKITAPVEVLCDVDNPLCGPHGASKIYGPQKGATPEMVDLLENALSHLADIIKKQLGLDIINIPGSGAAGGLAAGAIAFTNARLVSGIETVIAHSRLEQAIAQADWVITGEGRFDHQSLRGKVVSGIAQIAQKSDTKVAVIAGQVLLTPDQYQQFGITDAIACMNDDMTLDYAMKNSPELLAQAAKKFTAKHLTK